MFAEHDRVKDDDLADRILIQMEEGADQGFQDVIVSLEQSAEQVVVGHRYGEPAVELVPVNGAGMGESALRVRVLCGCVAFRHRDIPSFILRQQAKNAPVTLFCITSICN